MAGKYDDFDESLPEGRKFPALPPGVRNFLLFVVAPAVVITGACWLIAAPRYTAEFDFSVTNAAQSGATDAATTAEIAAYMKSPVAVAALAQRVNLATLYKGHGIDPVVNFWWDDGTTESLTRYWNRFGVKIKLPPGGGAARVRVVAFSAQDALTIAGALADLGGNLVTTQSAAATQTQAQLAAAAAARQDAVVSAAGAALTKLRAAANSVDPGQAILAAAAVQAGLTRDLATTAAERDVVRQRLAATAPAVELLDQKIASLKAQLAALADPQAIATYGSYETAVQNLADARALDVALHRDAIEAGAAASTASLSITQFVAPTAAKDPTYPQPGRIGVALFVLLTVAFGLVSCARRGGR